MPEVLYEMDAFYTPFLILFVYCCCNFPSLDGLQDYMLQMGILSEEEESRRSGKSRRLWLPSEVSHSKYNAI